jgi:hypothetical protein
VAPPDPRGKHPVERSLEVLVYLPLGFALEARQLYPRFIDRGRNQVVLARVMGKYATRQLGDLANEALDRNSGAAGETLRLLGLLPYRGSGPAGSGAEPAASASEPPEAAHAPSAGAEPAASAAAEPEPAREPEEAPPPAPPVDSLAIPDYDSLAASQVVPRLDALDAHELEAVRQYEHGMRGRKTILSKIAQLQAAG